MQLSLNQSGFAQLSKRLNRFAEWWLKEFWNLFPERFVALMAGQGQARLVIAARQDGADLELQVGVATTASEHLTIDSDTTAAIEEFLQSQGMRRQDVDVGLRLPADHVFGRQLLLPAEADGSIDAIVAQDLAKKTPFKAEDIYSDFAARARTDIGRIEIRQWIVRRTLVQQALVPMNMSVDQLHFIESDSQDSPVPKIRLRHAGVAGNLWRRKITPALWYSVLFLAVLSGGLRYLNQQAALDRLGEEIAATGKKAQQVRALVDQLQEKRSALVRLRLQRTESPGLLDLWEEATRILPLHSWLTEFRLVETASTREALVTMTGFSSAAPSLVGIIDGSRLFVDAALTSPVALDPTEGRERFALQAKVRVPDLLKGASR